MGTLQTIITACTVCTALGGALGLIIGMVVKSVRFFDRQKVQDEDIHGLEEKHNTDMKELIEALNERFAEISEEQRILTSGMLACLRGLQEQGCNGPVTKAISDIENHINDKAHPLHKGGTI